jgi:hypothetical protein
MLTKIKKILVTTVFLIVGLSLFYLAHLQPVQASSEKYKGTTIRGRVVSVYGPVESARVRVAGDETYTLTDKQGWFKLPTRYPPGIRVKVTAGKEGWFSNGQIMIVGNRIKDIFLNPVNRDDWPGYRFISPKFCSQCHVEVTRYWDQSKMAHTTSNPLVLNMYYGTDAHKRTGVGPGYKLDNPVSEGNCTICHAPSVAAAPPLSRDLNNVLRSTRTEWDGISCDYCHKVRKILRDKSKPSGTRALLERQAAAGSPSVLAYGPYDDVVVPPMAASYNPLLDKGQFCSLCHAHFKKLENGKTWDPAGIYTESEWNGFGLKDHTSIPIQTTYQEWKQWQDQLPDSDPNKGKKCQDCHMSWQKKMLPYNNYVVDGNARNMWGTYRSAKNIRPHHLEGGTETQLKTALALELEGEVKKKNLIITVFITNTNGGHWVPTGETMRSVMLLLQAVDSKGNSLNLTKGPRLPNWTGKGKVELGNYAGLPGAAFARVLKDDAGNIHVPFWRATGIASDTRIRPKDSVTLKFEFAIGNSDDEPSVEARLIYRPVIRSLANIKNWPVKDIHITSSAW